MIRGFLLATVTALVFPVVAPAQSPCQFRWQQGQVLTYQVEHSTTALDAVGDTKSETKTKLNLTKRWQVLELDAAGVATLQLSLLALRLEVTTPSGGTLLFDSANADKSDPHMSEELGKFLTGPLAVLRVDPRGRVVEVKQSKNGSAAKFEMEPPLIITLSGGDMKAGDSWARAYNITLEPPQGTGEKYEAVQNYRCNSVTQNLATIAFTSTLKSMPESILDRVPLLQLQPEGEVVFDLQAGRLHSASLHIDKELKGHQGEGSSYKFQSTYVEKYLGGM
jgi:hypothetical protein